MPQATTIRPAFRIRFELPSFLQCVFVTFSIRLIAAFVTFVGDCDETFNYWEPTHYLLFGTGFQTWEYSPEYGLRSYAYILLHVLFGKIGVIFGLSKTAVFFFIRACLALCCSLAEGTFVKGIQHRFGSTVAWVSYAFLISSAGMFQASISFLPSTFAMYCIMAAFGFWLRQGSANQFWTVFFMELAALLGWPFCALCAVPVALNLMCRSVLRFCRTLMWGFGSLALITIPMLLTDHYFYRRWLLAPLNIALYNVFNSNGLGPELYGVEPAHFYALNAGLNFNVVFVLAMLMPVIVLLARGDARAYGGDPWSTLNILSPLYIWFFFMSAMPHKEERFLYVVYPLFCLAAAIAVVVATSAAFVPALPAKRKIPEALPQPDEPALSVPSEKRRLSHASARAFVLVVILLAAVVSTSRVIALHRNYHAPASLYMQLADSVLPKLAVALQKHSGEAVRLCLGKEWYRFASSFFVPHEGVQVSFIRSGFTGLLPKPYTPLPNGTWTVPTEMNNANRMEPSRYVDESQCHLIVELDFEGQAEPHYLQMPQWSAIAQAPFLDAANSHLFARAFWIPWVSARCAKFIPYVVLRNRFLVGDDFWAAL